MADLLPFYLIDAFAEQPYRGNTAGVVLEADALSAEQMQQIARTVNASETAFVTRANDLHRPTHIRWFTPTDEVDFCGHATIAAAHALHEGGYLKGILVKDTPQLVLDSAAGELPLVPEELPPPYSRMLWWLAMPDPGLTPDNTNPIKTCELLGISIDDLDPAMPAMRTRDNDVIYVVQGWQTLMNMQPRMSELGDWCRRTKIRGICVATTDTPADMIDVQSRFFAPAVGVDEDPVTGSVHGPLVALLTIHGVVGSAGAHSAVNCIQGRPGDRTGLVRALVESTEAGYRVKIAGLCFTAITGQVHVPPVG